MTSLEALKGLKNIRIYCEKSSLPALEYAIKLVEEKAEAEAKSAKEDQ